MFARALALIALVTALIAPAAATAQSDPARDARVRQATQQMEAEPTIIEVHRAALEYFRVHPEEVDRLRQASVQRAGAPTLRITGRYEYLTTDEYVNDDPQNVHTTADRGSHVAGGTVSLEWGFPGAVFNPAQLQAYALVGIQMNVLKEVTRLYYVRRQLLLSALADPPADARARLAMEMRVEEFTSLIDSFTGGWFSRNLPGAATP